MLYIVATSVQNIFSLFFTEFETEAFNCVYEALGKANMQSRPSKMTASTYRLYILPQRRRNSL